MEDRSHQVLAVAVLFISLTWLTVGLRCYVRIGMLKSFGYDDYMMLITQLLFTTYIVCQLGGVVFGTGRHMDQLTPDHARTALEFWFLCELFYILSASMLKIAIGFFLLRVSVHKPHIWIIRIIIVGAAVFGTAYFFIALFQCHPVSAWWNHGAGTKYCMTPAVIVGTTYAASVINSLADWTFGILPIFIVWDLEMARRQKIMVAAILAFAAIGSTATIIRIPSISNLLRTEDFLYDTVDIAIWSTVEPGIGITAACIATLRPLLQLVLKGPGWRSNRAGSAHHSSHGKNSHLSQKSKRLSSRLFFRPDDVGNSTTVTATRPPPSFSYPGRVRKNTFASDDKLYMGDGIKRSIEISCEEISLDPEWGPPPQHSSPARNEFDRIAERHQQWL